MNASSGDSISVVRPLALAWLALVLLPLVSLGLGDWLHGTTGLELVVAVLIWLKSRVITRCFLEADSTHPFIRGVLRTFIACVPVALVLTAVFGARLVP